MRQINIYEAEKYFSRLIASVEKGEEIIIARHGKPVAGVIPIRKAFLPRSPGSAKGKFTVQPDFFKPLPDEILLIIPKIV